MWPLHHTQAFFFFFLIVTFCNHFKGLIISARRDQDDRLSAHMQQAGHCTPHMLECLSLHAPTRSIRQGNLLYVPSSTISGTTCCMYRVNRHLPRVKTMQNGMFGCLPMIINAFMGDRNMTADASHDGHCSFKRHVTSYVRKRCSILDAVHDL